MGIKKERGLSPFLFLHIKILAARLQPRRAATFYYIILYKICQGKNEKKLYKKDPEIRLKCIIKKIKKALTKTSYRCIISLTVKENSRKEVKHEKGYNDSSL